MVSRNRGALVLTAAFALCTCGWAARVADWDDALLQTDDQATTSSHHQTLEDFLGMDEAAEEPTPAPAPAPTPAPSPAPSPAPPSTGNTDGSPKGALDWTKLLGHGANSAQNMFNNYMNMQQQLQQQRAMMNGAPQGPIWGNMFANTALALGGGAVGGAMGAPSPCNTSNPWAMALQGIGRGLGQFGTQVYSNMQNAANNTKDFWTRMRNASRQAWQQQQQNFGNYWQGANLQNQFNPMIGHVGNQMNMMTNQLGQQLGQQVNGFTDRMGAHFTRLSSGVQAFLASRTDQLNQVARQLNIPVDQLVTALQEKGPEAVMNFLPPGEAKEHLGKLLVQAQMAANGFQGQVAQGMPALMNMGMGNGNGMQGMPNGMMGM